MCLYYNFDATNRVKSLLEKSPTKTKIFYKIYIVRRWKNQTGKGFVLVSPFISKKISESGEIYSNRGQKYLFAFEKINKEIKFGIHVFEEKLEAQEEIISSLYKESYKGYCVVVPAICSLKDFVGAGSFDGKKSSVFMKIKITNQTWNKIKGEK